MATEYGAAFCPKCKDLRRCAFIKSEFCVHSEGVSGEAWVSGYDCVCKHCGYKGERSEFEPLRTIDRSEAQ